MKIFDTQSFDEQDILEEELINASVKFDELVGPMLKIDSLAVKNKCNGATYSCIVSGLLYYILHDSARCAALWDTLAFIVTDQFKSIINKMEYLTGLANFYTIFPHVQEQILWVSKQLLCNLKTAEITPILYVSLMKQIRGGDTSDGNLKMASLVLEMLGNNRDWVQRYPELVNAIIFKYTRLSQDHIKFPELLKRESDFVCSLAMSTLPLGRDFVRLLQAVSSIPAYNSLLKDLLHSPTALHPEFHGIAHYCKIQTRNDFLILLLTLDMEFKLHFFLNNLAENICMPYLGRFKSKYLSTSESETLYPDLIRYICCVLHPRNEGVKSASLLKRWQLCRIFLACIQNLPAGQSAKLAIFYDTLFFNAETDDFMNLEPGWLLIQNSIEKGASNLLVINFLQFLHSVCTSYLPSVYAVDIRHQVRAALRSVLDNNIITSLDYIYYNIRNNPVGKEILEHLFPMFLTGIAIGSPSNILAEETVAKIANSEDFDALGQQMIALIDEIESSKSNDVELVSAFMDMFLKDFGKWDHSRIFARLKEPGVEEYLKEMFCIAIIRSAGSSQDLENITNWIIATDAALGGHIDAVLFDCSIKSFKRTQNSGCSELLRNLMNHKYDNMVLIPLIQVLFETNLSEFNELVPIFLRLFPNELEGNWEFISMVLSLMDPEFFLNVQVGIAKLEYRMFGKNIYDFCLRVRSLTSFERICAFQLLYTEIIGHMEDLDTLFPILWSTMRHMFDSELFSMISLLLLSVPFVSRNMLLIILTSPNTHTKYVAMAMGVLSLSPTKKLQIDGILGDNGLTDVDKEELQMPLANDLQDLDSNDYSPESIMADISKRLAFKGIPRTMAMFHLKKLSKEKMSFGQLIVGPPGCGKTTYCSGLSQFLSGIGRETAIVNLDPANDGIPYKADIDIGELVTLGQVMIEQKLGPNGGLIYCLEYLEANIDWLIDRLKSVAGKYLLFDLPGQVELFTNNNCLRNIVRALQKLDYRLCVVNLMDAHYCCDPSRYMSMLVVSLKTMLQLDCPQINILSKIDLLESYGSLAFSLEFYTQVQDLSYLLDRLEQEEDPFSKKFKKLNCLLCELVSEFGLVSFLTLAIEDKESVLNVLRAVDKANGYIYGGLTQGNESLFEVAARVGFHEQALREAEDKYLSGLQIHEHI